MYFVDTKILLLTDIFEEKVRLKNASVVTFSKGTTLLKAKEMFDHTGLKLDTFQVIILCLGHADVPYDNKIFKTRYRSLLASIAKVNAEIKIIFVSMLPLVWKGEFYTLLTRRSRVLKDMCGVDMDVQEKEFYLDMYKKLKVMGGIPPEFVRNERLNLTGIRRFINVLGHKLAGIQALWPQSDIKRQL